MANRTEIKLVITGECTLFYRASMFIISFMTNRTKIKLVIIVECTLFYKNWRHQSFFEATDTPVLGFKARVHPSLACFLAQV